MMYQVLIMGGIVDGGGLSSHCVLYTYLEHIKYIVIAYTRSESVHELYTSSLSFFNSFGTAVKFPGISSSSSQQPMATVVQHLQLPNGEANSAALPEKCIPVDPNHNPLAVLPANALETGKDASPSIHDSH